MWNRLLKIVTLVFWFWCSTSSASETLSTSLRFECSTFFDVWNKRIIEAYAQLGVGAECVSLPWARGAQAVASGKLDGSVLRVKEFGEQFPSLIRVEPPITTFTILLYRRKGEPIGLSNWRQYSIVSMRGSVLSDQLLAGLNVHRAGSVQAGLKQLSAGRVDLLLGDAVAIPAAIETLDIDNVEAILPPLASFPMYHFLRPEHQQLVDPISRQLFQFSQP